MKEEQEFLKSQGWNEKDQGSFDFKGLCCLLRKFKESRVNTFDSLSDMGIKYMAEEHHPHMILIITSTNAQIFEGVKSTGEVLKYIKD